MFSNPSRNLDQFDLRDGQIIVDMGSGSGHYTIDAAKRVSPNGRVYSVDVQKDLLQKIKSDAHKARFLNVETVWGDLEKTGGTRLKSSLADRIIISNTLFALENKSAVFAEGFRIMKPGGKLLIVDWTDSFGGLGPSSAHVFPKAKAKEMAEKQGFIYESEISAGDHHYGLIFKKK